LKIETCII